MKSLQREDFAVVVRLKGLEPSRRKTLDPKSSASANSATSACSHPQRGITLRSAKVIVIYEMCKFFLLYSLFFLVYLPSGSLNDGVNAPEKVVLRQIYTNIGLDTELG